MHNGTWVLRSACGFVLCGILIAGLWPFHSPRNDVAWVPAGNGLTFGPHGSIVSSGEFDSSRSKVDSSCSIELWLRPRAGGRSGTVLAFYHPNDSRNSLLLRQSSGDLLVQIDRQNGERFRFYVRRVFLSDTPLFITITSSARGTVAYIDGREFERFPRYQVREEDLSGKLLVGNSPVGTDEWSGQLLALAFYHQELTPSEILQHNQDWTEHKVSAISENAHAVAVYPFTEGTGSVAHNRIDGTTSLLIPKRFFVVNKKFLTLPWNEFYRGRSYWRNVAINIGGFIPLGYCFFAYLCSARIASRPALTTIILGFIVSLTIEVLQGFLPTRDSGLTDVITNTLGTAAGTMSYRYYRVSFASKVAKQHENVDPYSLGGWTGRNRGNQNRTNF